MPTDYSTYTNDELKREYALCKQELDHHLCGLEAEKADLKAILEEAMRRRLYISSEAEDDVNELKKQGASL